MEAPPKIINVSAESTPNPASLKFVTNIALTQGDDAHEFLNKEDAKDSQLAMELFNFPFVQGVFIASDFVTISKDESIEWHEVLNELSIFIKDFLTEGKPVLNNIQTESAPTNDDTDEPSPIEKSIRNILEVHIRPVIEGDGGAIQFKSYKDGVVTVVLRGACSGCPSAAVTLKNGIQAFLQRAIPEVKEVVAEEL